MPTLQPFLSTTNSTTTAGGSKKEKDAFLPYIMIVVGATVVLLLIPLAKFVFGCYRKKRRWKMHVRRQQLLKDQLENPALAPPETHIDGYGGEFHITPKNAIKPLPRSPVNTDPDKAKENITAIVEEDEPNLSEFQKENGIINQAFQGSNNMLSIPMRRSTTDLYLPTPGAIAEAAKRRFSEDLNLTRKIQVAEAVSQTKSSLEIPQKPAEDAERGTAISNETVNTPEQDEEGSDSDDYDDIYENFHHGETASDSGSSHIYDNIDSFTPRSSFDGVSDTDSEHIYSNVDELSDSDSHIYTNLEESTDGDRSDGGDDDEDIYENVCFRPIANGGDTETTSDVDSDSIIYENTDFLDERDYVSEDVNRNDQDAEGQRSPQEERQNARGAQQRQERGQKPEERGQKLEEGGRNPEERGQKPEERGQKPEERGQTQEERVRKPEERVRKPYSGEQKQQRKVLKPHERGVRAIERRQRPKEGKLNPINRGQRLQGKGQPQLEKRQRVQGRGQKMEGKKRPQIGLVNKERIIKEDKENRIIKRPASEQFV